MVPFEVTGSDKDHFHMWIQWPKKEPYLIQQFNYPIPRIDVLLLQLMARQNEDRDWQRGLEESSLVDGIGEPLVDDTSTTIQDRAISTIQLVLVFLLMTFCFFCKI